MSENRPTTAEPPFVPDGTAVHVTASAYNVSCLPDDQIDGSTWTIVVRYIGSWSYRQPRPADRQWTIEHRGFYLGRDGEWEPQVSGDWWDTHRFGLDEALELARLEAPRLHAGYSTVADVLARRAAPSAAEAAQDGAA